MPLYIAWYACSRIAGLMAIKALYETQQGFDDEEAIWGSMFLLTPFIGDFISLGGFLALILQINYGKVWLGYWMEKAKLWQQR